MISRRTFIALAFSALSTGWANAEGIDAASLARLEIRLAEWEALMRIGDPAATIEFIPPAMWKTLAAQAGSDAATYKEETIKLLQSLGKTAISSELSLEQGLEDAEFGVSETGRPYAKMVWKLVLPDFADQSDLLPSSIRLPVIAMTEESEWYFVKIEKPEIVTSAFPDLGPAIAELMEVAQ